ncbi:unnamed protein product [Closterium sp. NIES-64]|nr:unnamed protein product [Closterium sp. NIES-64]
MAAAIRQSKSVPGVNSDRHSTFDEVTTEELVTVSKSYFRSSTINRAAEEPGDTSETSSSEAKASAVLGEAVEEGGVEEEVEEREEVPLENWQVREQQRRSRGLYEHLLTVDLEQRIQAREAAMRRLAGGASGAAGVANTVAANEFGEQSNIYLPRNNSAFRKAGTATVTPAVQYTEATPLGVLDSQPKLGFKGISGKRQLVAGVNHAYSGTQFDPWIPDSAVCVGRLYIVQIVNYAIVIYNKRGKIVRLPQPLNESSPIYPSSPTPHSSAIVFIHLIFPFPSFTTTPPLHSKQNNLLSYLHHFFGVMPANSTRPGDFINKASCVFDASSGRFFLAAAWLSGGYRPIIVPPVAFSPLSPEDQPHVLPPSPLASLPSCLPPRFPSTPLASLPSCLPPRFPSTPLASLPSCSSPLLTRSPFLPPSPFPLHPLFPPTPLPIHPSCLPPPRASHPCQSGGYRNKWDRFGQTRRNADGSTSGYGIVVAASSALTPMMAWNVSSFPPRYIGPVLGCYAGINEEYEYGLRSHLSHCGGCFSALTPMMAWNVLLHSRQPGPTGERSDPQGSQCLLKATPRDHSVFEATQKRPQDHRITVSFEIELKSDPSGSRCLLNRLKSDPQGSRNDGVKSHNYTGPAAEIPRQGLLGRHPSHHSTPLKFFYLCPCARPALPTSNDGVKSHNDTAPPLRYPGRVYWGATPRITVDRYGVYLTTRPVCHAGGSWGASSAATYSESTAIHKPKLYLRSSKRSGALAIPMINYNSFPVFGLEPQSPRIPRLSPLQRPGQRHVWMAFPSGYSLDPTSVPSVALVKLQPFLRGKRSFPTLVKKFGIYGVPGQSLLSPVIGFNRLVSAGW